MSVADLGEKPGGPAPLIFRPNWGPKGRKQNLGRPPPPTCIRVAPPPPPPPPYLKVWIRHWMFSYKWIKGALSRLSWSFFTSAPISVKVALVKPWSMLHSQMFPKHIKYSKKKKNELWKPVSLTSFQLTQFQSVSVFFKFVHPCLISYVLCYLYLLLMFSAVIFTLFVIWWQFQPFEFRYVSGHL